MSPGVECAILVGRGDELTVLRDALTWAEAAQPATVLIGALAFGVAAGAGAAFHVGFAVPADRR